MPRAVFFDRDDTLIRNVPYLGDPAKVALFPDAREAVRQVADLGFEVFLITNQSGVPRGLITPEQVGAVNQEVIRQLGGAPFRAVYCSFGSESAPSDRKPSPQMVYLAAREHGLDLRRSFFVGDRLADILCGRNAGCRTVLVRTGENGDEWERAGRLADHAASSLTEAVHRIAAHAS